MSKNPGNTGQRWKMSTVADVQIHDDEVLISLECGHTYRAMPMWGTVEDLHERLKGRIGKRTSCNKCGKAFDGSEVAR